MMRDLLACIQNMATVPPRARAGRGIHDEKTIAHAARLLPARPLPSAATLGCRGLFFAIACLIAAPSDAQGVSRCEPHAVMVAHLANKYGETRQGIGIGADNTVLEIFASLKTGTWTIAVTATNGITCVVAAGQAYEVTSSVLPPQGDPL